MQRIRETALENFDSLFSPGRKIWTLETLQQFYSLFVQRFDEGKGTFFERTERVAFSGAAYIGDTKPLLRKWLVHVVGSVWIE